VSESEGVRERERERHGHIYTHTHMQTAGHKIPRRMTQSLSPRNLVFLVPEQGCPRAASFPFVGAVTRRMQMPLFPGTIHAKQVAVTVTVPGDEIRIASSPRATRPTTTCLCVLCVLCVVDLFSAIGGPRCPEDHSDHGHGHGHGISSCFREIRQSRDSASRTRSTPQDGGCNTQKQKPCLVADPTKVPVLCS
jgi:hypothetical protein